MRVLNSMRLRVALFSGMWAFTVSSLFALGGYVWLVRMPEVDDDPAAMIAKEVAARHEVCDEQDLEHFVHEHVNLDAILLEVESFEVWSPDAAERVVGAYRRSLPVRWDAGLTSAKQGTELSESDSDGRPYRIAFPLSHQGKVQWLAVLTLPPGPDLRAFLQAYMTWCLAAIVVATLVGGGGAYVVLSLGLAPIHALVRDARLIGEEGPGRRLEEPPPGSELRQLVQLLNTMLARTEQTVTQLKRFTAHASHELRTPLARMRAAAELGITQGDLPEAREALGTILIELDDVTQLVSALLQLAELDSIDPQIAVPVDIAELAEELSVEARMLGEARELKVTSHVADDARGSVLGHKTLLAHAVWNLLDNATKYTPSGGRIEVALSRVESRLQLDVFNDGKPIPASFAEQLFEPFFRGQHDAEDRPAGHGLGLALARSIVRRHQGELSCVPEPEGVRFRLTLPLA